MCKIRARVIIMTWGGKKGEQGDIICSPGSVIPQSVNF